MRENVKMNVSLINRRSLKELTHNLWLKEANVRVEHKQNFSGVTMNGAFPEVIQICQCSQNEFYMCFLVIDDDKQH